MYSDKKVPRRQNGVNNGLRGRWRQWVWENELERCTGGTCGDGEYWRFRQFSTEPQGGRGLVATGGKAERLSGFLASSLGLNYPLLWPPTGPFQLIHSHHTFQFFPSDMDRQIFPICRLTTCNLIKIFLRVLDIPEYLLGCYLQSTEQVPIVWQRKTMKSKSCTAKKNQYQTPSSAIHALEHIYQLNVNLLRYSQFSIPSSFPYRH